MKEVKAGIDKWMGKKWEEKIKKLTHVRGKFERRT